TPFPALLQLPLLSINAWQTRTSSCHILRWKEKYKMHRSASPLQAPSRSIFRRRIPSAPYTLDSSPLVHGGCFSALRSLHTASEPTRIRYCTYALSIYASRIPPVQAESPSASLSWNAISTSRESGTSGL